MEKEYNGIGKDSKQARSNFLSIAAGLFCVNQTALFGVSERSGGLAVSSTQSEKPSR